MYNSSTNELTMFGIHSRVTPSKIRNTKNTRKILKAAPMLMLLMVAYSGTANAVAHCFCQVACQDNTNYKGSIKGYIRDITVSGTYGGLNQQSDKNQTACNTECTAAASQISKADIAQTACSRGCPSGSSVMAWSKVGTREWKSAQGYGILQNTPGVKTYTCPTGWWANTTNIDGGVTSDGKCKKLAGHITLTPVPANGTQVGNWGFTWGSDIWAWGTTANGGAAVGRTTAGICQIP